MKILSITFGLGLTLCAWGQEPPVALQPLQPVGPGAGLPPPQTTPEGKAYHEANPPPPTIAAPATGEAAAPPADTQPPAPAPVVSDAIPTAYAGDRYEGTFARNPFLIKVAVQSAPQANWAEGWTLSYVREKKGVPTVGIRNMATNQSKKVLREPDEEGFRIDSCTIAKKVRDSVVIIAKGSETATLKFPDTAGGGAAPAGIAGQPNGMNGAMPNGANRVAMPGAMPQGMNAMNNRTGAVNTQRQGQTPFNNANNGGRTSLPQRNLGVPQGNMNNQMQPGMPQGGPGAGQPSPITRRRLIVPPSNPQNQNPVP